MTNYAVIKDNVVDNVIVADSQQIAETVTGLTCIEISSEPGAPGVGWSYVDSVFVCPIVEEPIIVEELPAE